MTQTGQTTTQQITYASERLMSAVRAQRQTEARYWERQLERLSRSEAR